MRPKSLNPEKFVDIERVHIVIFPPPSTRLSAEVLSQLHVGVLCMKLA